jgi:glycine cleavage system H protein
MYPEDLLYTKDHEWIRVEGDIGTIGITFHAQKELGDLVYVELPKPGAVVTAGRSVGSVESVKAVSDVYAPASGEVVAVNPELAAKPETINQDPYGRGWLARIRLSDPGELKGLMSAQAYQAYVSEESGR